MLTNGAGTRAYKVHIPRGAHAGALPLLVMLHGCTQSPDDFAAGTRMNALADEVGFYVVYPAQPESANLRKCWNWFNSLDQSRDCGEPSIIADITRKIIDSYPIDGKRVYVGGLSAGAAMAVVLAAAYPDLYAAVGCHSGMPYRCAESVYAAFSAMRSGNDRYRSLATPGIPLIVFQGDQDRTVNPRNSEQLVSQWIDSMPTPADVISLEETNAANGRRYSRRTYQDTSNGRVAEYWLIHGAGHAWSGGSSEGSYADPLGPDASRELVRFFLGNAAFTTGRKDRRRSVVARVLGTLRRRAGEH